jgi:hypothetical protein
LVVGGKFFLNLLNPKISLKGLMVKANKGKACQPTRDKTMGQSCESHAK